MCCAHAYGNKNFYYDEWMMNKKKYPQQEQALRMCIEHIHMLNEAHCVHNTCLRPENIKPQHSKMIITYNSNFITTFSLSLFPLFFPFYINKCIQIPHSTSIKTKFMLNIILILHTNWNNVHFFFLFLSSLPFSKNKCLIFNLTFVPCAVCFNIPFVNRIHYMYCFCVNRSVWSVLHCRMNKRKESMSPTVGFAELKSIHVERKIYNVLEHFTLSRVALTFVHQIN